VLPNITGQEQLAEFAAAPEVEDIPQEVVERLWELFDEGFGVEESPREATPAD